MSALVEFPSVRRGNKDWTLGRGYKYPWHTWMDGELWVLHQGEDFDVSTNSMAVVIYQTATRVGLKVRVQRCKEDGTVSFQFYKEDE